MIKRVSIHAICLLAAFLFTGFQQALAECGAASTYTVEGGTHAEMHNSTAIMAAHPSLPLGTRVIVRNQLKGRSIIVRIGDRSSPLSEGIIELSAGALKALQMSAFAPVCLEVVSYGSKKRGYENPSLAGWLLEVLNPKGRHYAKASSRIHSARAWASVRSAKVRHGHKRYARIRHRRGRRYAHLHRRGHSVKRSWRRRRLAARG